MSRFENQTYLVTGGTSGIGFATAKRLLQDGARVLITGSNPERVNAAKAELGVPGLVNDAGNVKAANELADWIAREVGTIDGAYLNAGVARFQPVDVVSSDEFDSMFAINVRGPLMQVRALAPIIREGGSIVFTTSVANQMGMPGAAVYSSTKGALRTLTRVLAHELAARNIRVNAVNPTVVMTPMSEWYWGCDDIGGPFLQTMPLKRWATEADCAGPIVFLLSDAASMVSGVCLPIDGGFTSV